MERPNVIDWYNAYCVFMAIIYALIVAAMAAALATEAHLEAEDPLIVQVTNWMMLVFCLVFGAAYIAALLMPKNKAGWIVGIVVISFGMTSACCLPATIPLLVFWLKPEVKAYYGMPSIDVNVFD